MATQTQTSFDPLTTIFTPPAWCNDGQSKAWTTHTSSDLTEVERQDSSCFPSHAAPGSVNGLSNNYITPSYTFTLLPTFSPGVCPSGQTAATTVVYFVAVQNADITTALCCGSGFTLDNGIRCRRSTTNQLGIQSTTFLEPAVPILWQAKDLSVFSAAASLTRSITSTTPAGSSSAAVSRPTSSQLMATEQPSGGLSSGAKAGIGVGVSIGVIALAALVAFGILWSKKHKGSRQSKMEPPMQELEQ